MQAYGDFLKANPNGVLATIEDGRPQTRIFQYLWHEENQVYFCTSNQKHVYNQLRANPRVAFCTWNPATFEVLNVDGEAHFVNDIRLKARALDENPAIRAIYNEPSNPVFEIFFIEVDQVRTFDFTNGPSSAASL